MKEGILILKDTADLREKVTGSMMEESIIETNPAIFMPMTEAEEDHISRIAIILLELKEMENGFVITAKLTNIVGKVVEITEITAITEIAIITESKY
jgi:hypothetical protein